MDAAIELSKRITENLEQLRGFSEWWQAVATGARFELLQRDQPPCAYSKPIVGHSNQAHAAWLGSWNHMCNIGLGPLVVRAELGPLVLQLRDGTGRCSELLTIELDWATLDKRKGVGKEKLIRVRDEKADADLALQRRAEGGFALVPTSRYLAPTALTLGLKCPAGPAIAALVTAFGNAQREAASAEPILTNLLQRTKEVSDAAKRSRVDFSDAMENAKKARI